MEQGRGGDDEGGERTIEGVWGEVKESKFIVFYF